MSGPVIDHAVFAELQEAAGAEFVRELVDTFMDEAPGLIAELHTSRAAGDAARFQRAAHSLKSNGSTFGALKLTDIAREIELKGFGSDETAVATLEAAYAEATTELKSLCNA